MVHVIRLVIISSHVAESEILDRAFKSLGFQVFASAPSASNYLQILQYKPDAILMEIPESYADSLASVKLLHRNERLHHVPVFCFGPAQNPTILSEFKQAGMKQFLPRPLKMGTILKALHDQYPDKDLLNTSPKAPDSSQNSSEEDQNRLLDPHETMGVKLEIMVKHVGKLLCFPFAASRVLQLSDQEDSGADDLAKVISADQGISSVILRVANSIHFASRNRVITTPRDAIVRLGFNEVRNIVLGLGVLQMVPDNGDTFGFDRKQFWLHSLGRAVISEKLAKHAGYQENAKAFLGGMLADFGILLLDQFFPKVFQRILKCVTEQDYSASDACIELLGFHHLELTCKLFTEWRLPKDLVDGLQMVPRLFERDPMPQPDSVRTLANAVAVAGTLVRIGQIGMGIDCHISIIPDSTMQELKQNLGVSPTFFDPVRMNLSIYMRFLEMESEELLKTESLDREVLFIRLGRRILDSLHLYMSYAWKIHLVKDLLSVESALASKSFDMVVLEMLPGGDFVVGQQILQKMVGVQGRNGKPISVLGLCPTDEHPTPPEGLRMRCMNQHNDLREFDQVVESLLV